MPTYDDKIDLYGVDGKLLEEQVPLEAISPEVNPTIINIIREIKRSVAINLAGLEKSLANAAYGGKANFVPGRELNVDIVDNADAIADKIRKMLQVSEDDNTSVEVLNNGKQLLVQVPSVRLETAGDYSVAPLATGAALVQSVLDTFDINKFHASEIKTAALDVVLPQEVVCVGAISFISLSL